MIGLKEFFTDDISEYVILRLPDDEYSEGSDIDILCRNKEKFSAQIVKIYENQGFQTEVNKSNEHLHIDYREADRLIFRFDLVDRLSYRNFSVDARFTDVVLDSRRQVTYNGAKVYVPSLENDHAIRFLEYIEHKDKPEKRKHYEYIKNHFTLESFKFIDVVNKYTNVSIDVEQLDKENVKLIISKSLEGQERIDYFLIWGHGLQYTEQILDIIREHKDLEILYIKKKSIGDISKFIEAIYSCDTVPFRHLIAKSRYLLDVEPEILFVLVKNNNTQEKLFGRSAFRHIQCQLIKDVKEKIRNKFNPEVDGKRTEQHVIHASDYESQVKHVLKVLDLPPIEYFVRQSNPDLDVPYHIRPFDNYIVQDIAIDRFSAVIFGKGLVPIEETPHYKYILGDKQPYEKYYRNNIGIELTDDHSPRAFDLMIENFQYDYRKKRFPLSQNKTSLIVGEKIDADHCQIVDGVHRAAILKHKGVKIVPVVLPVTKFMVCLVFSKDRALQLQAAIESFLVHCKEAVEIAVLYKATNSLHQKQYDCLQKKFRDINFYKEYDFKRQTMEIITQFQSMLFLVDDNIFVGDFSLADIVNGLIKNENAIGFSLRLGKNVNYCYPKKAKQNLPVFQSVGNRILKFDWTKAEYDYAYPLEVSSSVYRTNDFLSLLKKQKYDNPNTLEGVLANNAGNFFTRFYNALLCYETSVAFTVPVNLVQTVAANRVGNDDRYSTEKLAQMFDDGFRIDIKSYSGFVPESCQQEIDLLFEKRIKD